MGASGLGSLLVKEGFLSEQDRTTINKTCGHGSWAFAKSILTMGLLDEDELAAFFAERTRYVVAPKNFLKQLDPYIVRHVDRRMFARLEVLPLEIDDQKITVAVADPLDKSTLKQLEFFTGLEIVPIIAPLSQIYEGLTRLIPEFQPRFSALSSFLRNHAGTAWVKQKIIEQPDLLDAPSAIRSGAKAQEAFHDDDIEETDDFADDDIEQLDAADADQNFTGNDFEDLELDDEPARPKASAASSSEDIDLLDSELDDDNAFDSFGDDESPGAAPSAKAAAAPPELDMWSEGAENDALGPDDDALFNAGESVASEVASPFDDDDLMGLGPDDAMPSAAANSAPPQTAASPFEDDDLMGLGPEDDAPMSAPKTAHVEASGLDDDDLIGLEADDGDSASAASPSAGTAASDFDDDELMDLGDAVSAEASPQSSPAEASAFKDNDELAGLGALDDDIGLDLDDGEAADGDADFSKTVQALSDADQLGGILDDDTEFNDAAHEEAKQAVSSSDDDELGFDEDTEEFGLDGSGLGEGLHGVVSDDEEISMALDAPDALELETDEGGTGALDLEAELALDDELDVDQDLMGLKAEPGPTAVPITRGRSESEFSFDEESSLSDLDAESALSGHFESDDEQAESLPDPYAMGGQPSPIDLLRASLRAELAEAAGHEPGEPPATPKTSPAPAQTPAGEKDNAKPKAGKTPPVKRRSAPDFDIQAFNQETGEDHLDQINIASDYASPLQDLLATSEPSPRVGRTAPVESSALTNELLLRSSLCFDAESTWQLLTTYAPRLAPEGCLLSFAIKPQVLLRWQEHSIRSETFPDAWLNFIKKLLPQLQKGAWMRLQIPAAAAWPGKSQELALYRSLGEKPSIIWLGAHSLDEPSLLEALSGALVRWEKLKPGNKEKG